MAGNPTTPEEDEADVAISVSLTDVRTAGDLSDYTGEVLAKAGLQIDRPLQRRGRGRAGDDGRHAARRAGAVRRNRRRDYRRGLLAITTADAVVPGLVREGDRAIWELGRIEVWDGGPDGDVDTADNDLFATQGLFIP